MAADGLYLSKEVKDWRVRFFLFELAASDILATLSRTFEILDAPSIVGAFKV